MSVGGAAAGIADLMFIVKELKIPADCSLPIAYGMNNKGDVVGQVTAPGVLSAPSSGTRIRRRPRSCPY